MQEEGFFLGFWDGGCLVFLGGGGGVAWVLWGFPVFCVFFFFNGVLGTFLGFLEFFYRFSWDLLCINSTGA